jgi:hypothetical protein
MDTPSGDRSKNGGTTMKKAIIAVCVFLGIFVTAYAFAHTPFCSCLDNGDGTILCEGGFLDGSSAVGVKIKVVDAIGKILIEGYIDKKSEFSFNKPSGEYTVILDAGFEHTVIVHSSEIAE